MVFEIVYSVTNAMLADENFVQGGARKRNYVRNSGTIMFMASRHLLSFQKSTAKVMCGCVND